MREGFITIQGRVLQRFTNHDQTTHTLLMIWIIHHGWNIQSFGRNTFCQHTRWA